MLFAFGIHCRCVLDSVAAPGDGNDLGVVEKTVQDGPGGGHVVQELAPFLERPVAGHDRGTVFITPHDHLQGKRHAEYLLDRATAEEAEVSEEYALTSMR